MPGLGQAVNGQWGKGLAFFFGTGVAGAAAMFAGPVGLAAYAGVGIWSIVDAVKNAKP